MGDTQEREYRHAPGSRDAEFAADQRSAFMARPLVERLTKIEETTLSSCFEDAPRAWERDTIREAKAEITRLRSELEKARSLLHNAPILKIDMQVAKRLGETEAVAYAQALAKWTPLAEAFLASSPPVPEQKD